MASPPALPSSLAKKRPSEINGPAHTKRRKGSMISLSHPLRQTSFPPEMHRSPSPSAHSFVSSAVSGVAPSTSTVAPPAKKKRGRKSKKELAEAEAAEGRNGNAAQKEAEGKEKKQVEEEDDEKPPLMQRINRSEGSKEAKREENRLRAMLVEEFAPAQYDRYERWRAVKLADSTVRKVVNAAASQSAPPTAVLAVRTVTKMFMGDIIELARRVQTEWIIAGTEPLVDFSPPDSTNPSAVPGVGNTLVSPPHSVQGEDIEARRGPLRPEHLREAQRRYKLGIEGGPVGMSQPWHVQQQTGVERFSTRNGRRIFK